MTHVIIPRQHRADFATETQQAHFSLYSTVIDVQPNETQMQPADLAQASQCARCNFVNFLQGVDNLDAYHGLSGLRSLFKHLPAVHLALSQRNGPILQEFARSVECNSVFELTAGHAMPPRMSGVPRIHRVQFGQGTDVVMPQASRESEQDWVLIEPNEHGPTWVLNQIDRLHRLGYRRVLVGFYEHAQAMDKWASFFEREAFAGEWQMMMLQVSKKGLDRFGFMMSFPPCASLQWRGNIALERLRSRLDLQFRQIEGNASMMCPENVSGYSLYNDMKDFAQAATATQHTLCMRYESLLFCT
ncbi:hypothetical protein [Novosphingobium sp.]|uniref:hypothetical protein n=1 Tax=Novosphingobium sp. TaxID=1874826 RepID=UPI003D11F698